MIEIPMDEESILSYGGNIIAVSKKYAVFLGLDRVKIAELEELHKTLNILRVKCKSPERTKPDTELKRETKTSFLKNLRVFIKGLQANPKMTDVLRAEFNITIASRTRKRADAPKSGPEGKGEISADSPGKIMVRYLGRKPKGSVFIEIAYVLSAVLVTDHELLVHRETFSRNPWSKIFPDADRGGKFYFALRYVTKKGVSNWSEIKMLIVP